MTFEEAVAQVNKKKLLVSSLYQYDVDHWRCALRPYNDWSYWHGEGKTATDALLKASMDDRKRRTEKDWEELRKKNPKKVERHRIRR